jgi:hypothetical protein
VNLFRHAGVTTRCSESLDAISNDDGILVLPDDH